MVLLYQKYEIGSKYLLLISCCWEQKKSTKMPNPSKGKARREGDCEEKGVELRRSCGELKGFVDRASGKTVHLRGVAAQHLGGGLNRRRAKLIRR